MINVALIFIDRSWGTFSPIRKLQLDVESVPVDDHSRQVPVVIHHHGAPMRAIYKLLVNYWHEMVRTAGASHLVNDCSDTTAANAQTRAESF